MALRKLPDIKIDQTQKSAHHAQPRKENMSNFRSWPGENALCRPSYVSASSNAFAEQTESLCAKHGITGQEGGFAIGLEYWGGQGSDRRPIYYRFFPGAVNGSGKNLGTLSRLFEAGILTDGSLTSGINELGLSNLAALFTSEQRSSASAVKHTNLFTLKSFTGRCDDVRPVVHFSRDVNRPLGESDDLAEAWFRLMALSTRQYEPNGLSCEGMFGVLENLAWCGPQGYLLEDYDQLEIEMTTRGEFPPTLTGLDKFPTMTSFVHPSGVRVADASRVRLGAHLAEGTTVMHEGFVNFNAGTLGASMVEGRISAGVVVGDGSDIGGGASIMGTLSGGGKETISIGEGCLLGANSGLGISLGDDCIVEAGLYLTAGTKVRMVDGPRDGQLLRAWQLSGESGLQFRRDSVDGSVKALINSNAVELNEALHAN